MPLKFLIFRFFIYTHAKGALLEFVFADFFTIDIKPYSTDKYIFFLASDWDIVL